jgi:catechol 2,3-dioxygenase-like lactoylglutathione lyase family enzyme
MKTHLNLAARDITKSVEFYRTLLAAQPVKQHDDYALFVTDDPGLELALSLDSRASATSDVHYGIVVETPGLVDAAAERLQTAGFAVDVENDEVCCYARQSKVWASDPEGRRWETYYVIEETEQRMGEKACSCPESLCETVGCCR